MSKLNELLPDIDLEEMKDSINVAIDFDSLLFFSLHKQDNIELAYADLFMRVGTIVSQFYSKAKKVEHIVLAITGKNNFKKDLTTTYKAKRKSTDLSQKVSELKKILWKRLDGYNFKGDTNDCRVQIVSSNVFEADEIVLYLNKYKDFLIASVDSDIHLASNKEVFNYKKFEFTRLRDSQELAYNHILQSITGNHNDVSGIKGKGLVFAEKFLNDESKTFSDYVELFPSNEDMLLQNRLVGATQYDKNFNLKLLEVEDIESLFIEAKDIF